MIYRRIPIKFVLLTVLFTFFLCEYLIYYVVIFECSWKDLDQGTSSTRAMFISDTHLLGTRNGHWFDKLRREWQMYRSFQTAITLHRPDVVFFLGDNLDEGDLASAEQFKSYAARFHDLFYVPSNTLVYSVSGNHDVGFHFKLTLGRVQDFENKFDSPPVRMVEINDNIFIMINSMVMEGDGCHFCKDAERKLRNVGKILNCTKTPEPDCHQVVTLPRYSRPIILQHFPLFRQSDANCSGPDAAIGQLRTKPMLERWECLSINATSMLLQTLNPRLVIDGHTHNGCYQLHPPDIQEWTVPSFSWRNRNNPAFLLVTLTPSQFAVSKCFLPRESTVIVIYTVTCLLLAAYVTLSWRRNVTSSTRVSKTR